MAGIANPGLLLRTCTTSIFNKIKDKSDTTLYFVTPDVNSDIAGVTNMQAVSLYRGENIIEDSNVIFVRDYNLPTYIDSDSETIYYRHHCMESHAQSLTSTITGAPGQKLYVLFIDSSEDSPTYNQIIDAFMYIWQTDFTTVDTQQFTAHIDQTDIITVDAATDLRNVTPYEGVLDGSWTISTIEKFVPGEINDTESTTGIFEGTLTCADKRLGIDNQLAVKLSGITPGISISKDCIETQEENFLTTASDNTATIILRHSPVTINSIKIYTTEPVRAGSDDLVVYETDGTNIVYDSTVFGTVDYTAGTLTFNTSYSGMAPAAFVRKAISKIEYTGATGHLVLNITKTVSENADGELVPDIFTLYIGHAIDTKPVLERNHNTLTSGGCWLGFCIKNDTTDLFQVVNTVYHELKHIENEIAGHYEAIQDHRRTYQDTKIVYRTLVSEMDHGKPVLNSVTGEPVVNETARVIINGYGGKVTIGGNTNTETVSGEYLSDESPNLTHTPIVPASIKIVYKRIDGGIKTIEIADSQPQYYRAPIYDKALTLTTEYTDLGDGQVERNYYLLLENGSIARESILLKVLVQDTQSAEPYTLVLRDTVVSGVTDGYLIDPQNPGITYGTINYSDGKLCINQLANLLVYDDNGLIDAKITYDWYVVDSQKGTLLDTDNKYWGDIEYTSGIISGDLAEVITKVKESPSILDSVIAEYQYTINDNTADLLYFESASNKTSFYKQVKLEEDTEIEVAPPTTTIDHNGNIYTAGILESDSHYPNETNVHDLGSLNKRWKSSFVHLLDASELAKTPILEVTDIVPYNEQPNNVINIGTRNGEVEAVNINAESSNTINLKSLSQLNAETKQITLLGSEKVDVKSQDINLLNKTGTKVLLHTNESGSEFHDRNITFIAEDGQIISGTHSSNKHNTYDLGSNDNRWRTIYGAESRFNNLYVNNIQSDTTGTIDVNSTLETQHIKPHTDNTYDLGTSDAAYKSANSYNVSVDTINALNAANITFSDSIVFKNSLEAEDNAVFRSNIQVDQTAAINNMVVSTTAEFKDSSGNYIIGDTPTSLVVIGEEGIDKREENTLLGVKSAIIGADTDTMSDFTMHGIKKYLDYAADTLAQVIFVDCPTEEDDIEAINSKTFELEIQPVESNIAIVRRPIATDTLDTESTEDDITRYSYTGYVYIIDYDSDGVAWPIWKAMTGNYSAKDIYFTQDFKFTGPVGTVTQKEIDDNNGYVARRATGRNLQDFMYDLFAQSKQPNVADPTYSLSASATTSGDNEVGTYITALNWNGTFNSGSYQYGSVNVSDRNVRNTDTATGITATYEVSNNITTGKSNLLDSETNSRFELNYCHECNYKGDLLLKEASGGSTYWQCPNCGNTDQSKMNANKIQIDTVGSKVYATVTGICTTIDSPRIPVNNLHDPVDDLQIKSKTFERSANISVSGHRKMFYGSSVDTFDITSNNIRTKLQSSATGDTNSINVTVVEGAKHVIIALPAGRKLSTLVNPDSKIDLTKVEGVITNTTHVVEGANGFGAEGTDNAMSYTVYEYKSGAALSANTYTATITNV